MSHPAPHTIPKLTVTLPIPLTISHGKQYTKIGAGSWGKIYHQSGDPHAPALKWPQPARGSDCLWSIDHEFAIQKAITTALSPSGIDIVVPSARRLISADDDEWWTTHLPLFHADSGIVPKDTIAMARIPALSPAIRTGLTNKYCSIPSKRATIQSEPAAAHAMARVYLGRRRRSRSALFYSLRSINLWLDQLEELEADVTSYAEIMAQTLAVLHWNVRCDARDVEFWLGGPGRDDGDGSERKASGRRHSLFGEPVQLYLLDFNQVAHVSMDEEGVKKMGDAHAVNDPYYPRPLAEGVVDQELWRRFRNVYLETSSRLAQTEAAATGETPAWVGLPQKFIDGVIEARRKKITENAKGESRTLELDDSGE